MPGLFRGVEDRQHLNLGPTLSGMVAVLAMAGTKQGWRRSAPVWRQGGSPAGCVHDRSMSTPRLTVVVTRCMEVPRDLAIVGNTTGGEPGMEPTSGIADHYTSGDLLERLEEHLRDDGVDPARPTLEELAPYDQFHARGLEATEDMARHLPVSGTDRILDIGSGLGGPARYMARRFGCRVAGIDLTAEFCEVARLLTARLGFEERVTVEQGDALAMPFEDGAFDGAYSMNVSMNIRPKRAFYREIHRVLKPGAWLCLSEVAQGPGGEPDYPLAWAASAASSFLSTPEATRADLEAEGFRIEHLRDTSSQAHEFAARSRAVVEAGGKPLHRAVILVHGEKAGVAMANSGRAMRDRRVLPIEVLCRR